MKKLVIATLLMLMVLVGTHNVQGKTKEERNVISEELLQHLKTTDQDTVRIDVVIKSAI